ncbi:MAG: right-handed parallel beta-helix repeat-containing protein, partial [Sedimentisphaerales bacterium]|nr:right-handed parallel beta-helix repeat-containing protein [Sedimentisphaerales bacterium]
ISIERSGVRLSDCAVLGGPGDGVRVFGGSNVEVERTLVAAVWGTGVVIGDKAGLPSRVRIHDSDIRNCHYAGVRIAAGNDETQIERCRISGAAWHGVRYDDVSPAVIDSLIFSNARSGIYASGVTAATVKGNLFYANEMCGVSCWFQNKDLIEGNTFAANKRSGLEVCGASKPTIRGNIFYASPTGVSTGDIGSDSPFAKSDGSVAMQGNLFWANEQDVKAQVDAETDRMRIDPGFAAPEVKDFSLQADSPARQKGIGAAKLIPLQSPWSLQDEELAIIPKGDTRDSRQWQD